MSDKAAIYVRVSGSLQEKEGASLETQESACRAKLRELGYEPASAKFYKETHTGIDFFERPVLSELRAGIRRGEIDVVMVYDLDRLSRDAGHLGVVFTEAKFYGADFQFVIGEYEDSPEGEAVRFIRGMSGKIEHERIRDKARRGHQGRVDNGLPTVGPRPPYGYRWVEGVGPKGKVTKLRLEPDPDTAPVVERMFREIALGSSARQIAMSLTKEGVPSPSNRGNPWTGQTITKLLREPVYVGQKRVLNTENVYVQVPGLGRRVKHKPREQPKAMHKVAPPLIEPEIATAAIGQLARNKTTSVRNNRNPELTLLRGGVAKCGYCGRSLHVQAYRGFLHYICTGQDRYGCPFHAISVKKLDTLVWDKVREVVTKPDIVAAELERQRDEDPTAGDLEAIDRRIAELSRKQANLIKRLADVDDSLVELVQRELKTLTNSVKQLRDERETLLRIRTGWQDAQGTLRDLEAWCHHVSENLDALSYSERRLALQALGVEARLWKSDHDPRLDITMSLGFLENTVSSSR